MAKTLITPADFTPEYDVLFNFYMTALDFARRARKNYTDPDGLNPPGDTITLEQANPAVEQANVEAVFDEFHKIQELLVKVADAISEYQFALNFLKDRAYRKPQLPSSIEGPHFDTVTSEAP